MSTTQDSCSCSHVGCTEKAIGFCAGCHTAAYCGAMHMEEDWAAHQNVCHLHTQSQVGAAMWAVEAEVGEDAGLTERWEPMQLQHLNTEHGEHIDNVALAEEIGARADFKADLSVIRGVQRLPSGSMHRGEKVEVFVKTATFETSVVVQLPSRAHYNVFKRNGGYNVFLNQQDIRSNRMFRPVPLEGLLAVGLGTAEQKVLVYGEYSITQLAPESLEKRFLDLARRIIRRPRLVRVRAFDRSTQMAVSITMEQDVSASQQGLGDADAVYNITYVEIYVPYQFTAGYPRDANWSKVFDEESSKDDVSALSRQRVTPLPSNAASSETDGPLPPPPPPPPPPMLNQEQIEAAFEGYAEEEKDVHPEEVSFIANFICGYLAEEHFGDLHIESEAALEEDHLLVGALLSDQLADAHDSNQELALDEIGENIIKRGIAWIKRRRAKAKAKKAGQSGGGDEDVNAQVQAQIEEIGISVTDWFKSKRALVKQKADLKTMSVKQLTDLMREKVNEAKMQRAGGRIAGNEVSLANSIKTELSARGIKSTPELLELQKELLWLTSTRSSARQTKRASKGVSASQMKRAAQDAIDYPEGKPDGATDPMTMPPPPSASGAGTAPGKMDLESPAANAALVASLLEHQDFLRAQKQNAIAAGSHVPDHKREKLDSDISRVTSILSDHIEALCNDENGIATYDYISGEVVSAFDQAQLIQRSLADTFKAKYAKYKKVGDLKNRSIPDLVKVLLEMVEEADAQRKGGRIAGDEVAYANNINNHLRSRGATRAKFPQLGKAQDLLVKLTSTRRAARSTKRATSRVDASKAKRAAQDAIDYPDEGGNAQEAAEE